MMHKVADYIRTDGKVERLPTTVAKMDLEDIQAKVGGYVEHVDCGHRVELWCNEEGRLVGLAHNKVASTRTGMGVVGNAIVEYWE